MSFGQRPPLTMLVTVYIPAVLAPRSISPVVVDTNTKFTVEENVPAIPPLLYTGSGFVPFAQ